MINKPRDSSQEPLTEEHKKEIERRIKNVTDRLSQQNYLKNSKSE